MISYWLLWRPIIEGQCTYADVFKHELFDFQDINAMHQLLDLKLYDAALDAAEQEKSK